MTSPPPSANQQPGIWSWVELLWVIAQEPDQTWMEKEVIFWSLQNHGLDSKMSHLTKHCLPSPTAFLCPSLEKWDWKIINYGNQTDCALERAVLFSAESLTLCNYERGNFNDHFGEEHVFSQNFFICNISDLLVRLFQKNHLAFVSKSVEPSLVTLNKDNLWSCNCTQRISDF